MDDNEFQALLRQFPKSVGFSSINKIDWGLMTQQQLDIILPRVPADRQAGVRQMHANGYNTRLFTENDRDLFTISVFSDTLLRVYERNDPEGYYQYLYQEASVTADWREIAAVYNMLFNKVPGPRPSLTLKPALDYRKATADDTTTYLFTGGQAAADTWREALTRLMVLGFHACPRTAGSPLDPSLATAMLENSFIEQIAADTEGFLGSTSIKVFWRCDSRNKAKFIDERKAEASVDLVERAAELNLSQAWNPYSADKVKNAMWLRKAQRDNDYYTIVSIALDFKTSAPFPTLDEAKNPDYQFPAGAGTSIKELKDWTTGELAAHRKNLARVMVRVNGKEVEKIRLCTVTYAYMAVVNSGFVINTQSYGGGSFPERAVRGVPADSVAAYLPFYRVHHGGAREAGFTMFPAGTDTPQLLLNHDQLVNRCKLLGAEVIEKAFFDAKGLIIGKGKLAWSANGSAAPNVALDVTRVIERPLKEAIQPNDPRLL